MSLTLFEETFIYGNLELVYKPTEIIKIDLSSIKLFYNLDYGFIWRFFVNMKFLLYSNQYVILQKYNESKKIIDFLFNHINYYQKKLQIKNYKIDQSISLENCFKCIIITLLKDIKNNFLNLSDQNIKLYFDNFFKNYQNFCEQNFIIHYSLPFEENTWSPSWNIYINDKRFVLENIDIYIDTYFRNNNILYNLYLKDNLKVLYQRLENIDIHTKLYKSYIFKNLNKVTKKIFSNFPLNIIYNDYMKLLDFPESYVPPIIKENKLTYKNEDIWVLSIIPNNVRCYLLGIPIFSSSIISTKNQINIIKKINETSLQSYYKKIYKKNKYIINHLLFDLPVGNITDDEQDFVDISYNSINKYNFDDIIINFNNGIAHIFTCTEFKELLKKKQNFYNREPFNLIEKVNYNIKNKKELIYSLNNRHIDINLDSTLEENFNNLKLLLKSKDNLFVEKNNKNTNSILDIFFNQEFTLF